MIESIKGFHEEPTEIKARFYTRGVGLGPIGVSYVSNVDLYNSKAASWKYVYSSLFFFFFFFFFNMSLVFIHLKLYTSYTLPQNRVLLEIVF